MVQPDELVDEIIEHKGEGSVIYQCGSCNKTLPEDFSFCPACGAEFSSDITDEPHGKPHANSVPPEVLYCRVHGAVNRDDAIPVATPRGPVSQCPACKGFLSYDPPEESTQDVAGPSLSPPPRIEKKGKLMSNETVIAFP